jgi:hypothetical protein
VAGTSVDPNTGTEGSGHGTGVFGSSAGGNGVEGYADSGQGVLGQSGFGRGGVFIIDPNRPYQSSPKDDARSDTVGNRGYGVAQVRMVPSRRASHPTKGLSGDFFVDAKNRLWFCSGGTTWTRLA